MPTRKDPNDLSLQPSTSAGDKQADFSNVQSQADTVPGKSDDSTGSADFSNVQAHADTVPGDGSASSSTHTVEQGDTLSSIAQKHYGKAGRWRAIFDANKDQIDNPDLIYPGQVLKLPALED